MKVTYEIIQEIEKRIKAYVDTNDPYAYQVILELKSLKNWIQQDLRK